MKKLSFLHLVSITAAKFGVYALGLFFAFQLHAGTASQKTEMNFKTQNLSLVINAMESVNTDVTGLTDHKGKPVTNVLFSENALTRYTEDQEHASEDMSHHHLAEEIDFSKRMRLLVAILFQSLISICLIVLFSVVFL
ncbi:hypothetical protein GS399_14900 [Pedobacter sp. HMF7647]|uniref:Uncharacterized protein n=1 Tax=Hufsiella arboris TaxID=2695275 RepID=A0A7K1YCF5_9SPHI|nr:hypothetical protein [Hufsiella arboris]MXV52264.1 hypothetical protein [Hufsiella arboris]